MKRGTPSPIIASATLPIGTNEATCQPPRPVKAQDSSDRSTIFHERLAKTRQRLKEEGVEVNSLNTYHKLSTIYKEELKERYGTRDRKL